MTAFLVAALLALEDTPEKTVQAFVDAFNAHDMAGASRRVVGQNKGDFPIDSFMPTLKISMGKSTVQGDTARVEIDAEMFASGRSAQKAHETVRLRRVGGDWRIVPSDPDNQGAMRTELVGSLAYVLTSKNIFARAKQAAKKTMCLSNVKQLALGTIMYATDHNETLPKAAAWKTAIRPYLRDEKVFHCPDDKSGGVSYFLDPRVGGKTFASIGFPAETAMILEGTPKKTAFRHAGRANLGYLDGHAKGVDAAAVLKARTIRLK